MKREIETIIKKYENLNLGNSLNTLNTTDEKAFNNKLKEGFNYPCYPGHKEDKNLLNNFRKYLIKKKKNIKKK